MYNANNYGYNPYGTYIPQRNMPQPIEQTNNNYQQVQPRPTLSGKLVDNLETAKITEYQLDGSTSYFPLTDGSAIVSKQLQMDGTSKITIFKPITEQKEEIKYITSEDMEKAIKELDFSDLDDIKDDIKELRQEIKEIKKNKKKEE